jgi:NADH pyrophosphatase NudC (nudix superfamily)
MRDDKKVVLRERSHGKCQVCGKPVQYFSEEEDPLCPTHHAQVYQSIQPVVVHAERRRHLR